MLRICSRVRKTVALAGSLCVLVAWCPSSFALDPTLDVSQYAHTSWKVGDGMIKGTVHAITQTPDGYLWLGTEFGLLRLEALRNAFRHAQAKRIEVEILFERTQFRLRIRDDGKGIDPEVLRAGSRPGHYGLTGMHERAKQVGGKVDLWSDVDSGTEVELTIPAKIAYAKSPPRRWSTPW